MAHSGATTCETVPHSSAPTARALYQLVQATASKRLGHRIMVHLLSTDGALLPADETPVAALGTPVHATLHEPPRLLRCEPLWGPEHGSTLVRIHGEGFMNGMQGARVSFGHVDVPCERVSETVLKCTAPPHATGLVSVQLRRCEEEASTDEDTATFEYMRLEAAFDAIFATTNSFCPLRGPEPARQGALGAKGGPGPSQSEEGTSFGQQPGSKRSSQRSSFLNAMFPAQQQKVHVAVFTALMLAPTCQCCDWTSAPWGSFDGRRSRVVDAADGAPTAWLLNGSCSVRRTTMSAGCLDQMLTFQGCEEAVACAESARPHALVEMRTVSGWSHASAIGGALQPSDVGLPRAAWRLLGVNESVLTGSRRVYAFGRLASAVIATWVEEDGHDTCADCIMKHIVVRPSGPHVLMHMAVNVMAC